MGFGRLSVSGIVRQKRDLGPLLGDVSHLPLPYDAGMRFSAGQAQQGRKTVDEVHGIGRHGAFQNLTLLQGLIRTA